MMSMMSSSYPHFTRPPRVERTKQSTPAEQQFDCCFPSPYPSTGQITPNPSWLPMLAADYTAKQGKLTCFTQYIYQSVVVKQQNPDLSACLYQIAVIEMKHLHLLGELIVCLGGNPRFINRHAGHTTAWHGGMVLYHQDIIRLLQQDILLEQQSIRMFEAQIQYMGESPVCALLQRMAQEDTLHIKLFEQFLTHEEKSDSTV